MWFLFSLDLLIGIIKYQILHLLPSMHTIHLTYPKIITTIPLPLPTNLRLEKIIIQFPRCRPPHRTRSLQMNIRNYPVSHLIPPNPPTPKPKSKKRKNQLTACIQTPPNITRIKFLSIALLNSFLPPLSIKLGFTGRYAGTRLHCVSHSAGEEFSEDSPAGRELGEGASEARS